jgi:hypothetical protein
MNSAVTRRSQGHKVTGIKFALILFFVLCFLLSVACFLSPVLFAQDEIVYEDELRRDPFMALVTPDGRLINLEPTGAEEKIVLGGIYYDEGGNSYAIINGEVVGIGDYILGYTVSSIDKNKVILLQGDQSVEYILEKEEL